MVAYSGDIPRHPRDIREGVGAAVKEKGISKSEVAKLFELSRATGYGSLELAELAEAEGGSSQSPSRTCA
jgi:transposase